MKKLLIALMAVTLTANAGIFSTVSGMGLKEVEPKVSYTINTVGVNPRIYEFTPMTQPSMTCVVIFGNAEGQSTQSMQCFKKQ